jgi:DNA-binding response OmpR family regulator
MLSTSAVTSKPSLKRVIKVLFIYANVDEKSSSSLLESSCSLLVRPYIGFTCVTSGFTALECLKATEYDLVIFKDNLTDLSFPEFHTWLGSHNPLPVILLLDAEIINSHQIPSHYPMMNVDLLADPYTTHELATTIHKVLNRHNVIVRFIKERISGDIGRSSSSSNATTASFGATDYSTVMQATDNSYLSHTSTAPRSYLMNVPPLPPSTGLNTSMATSNQHVPYSANPQQWQQQVPFGNPTDSSYPSVMAPQQLPQNFHGGVPAFQSGSNPVASHYEPEDFVLGEEYDNDDEFIALFQSLQDQHPSSSSSSNKSNSRSFHDNT